MALNKKKKIIIIIVCVILIIGSILLSVFLVNERNKIDDLNKNMSKFTVGVGTREDKGFVIDFNKFDKLTRKDFNVEVSEGLHFSNGKIFGDNFLADSDEVGKCYVKYKKYIIIEIDVVVLDVEKVIYTYADFLSIANKNESKYILGRNIDLKSETKSLEVFKGRFYANNFIFSNFNFNVISSLFGKTENAHIEGVKVENVFGKRTQNKVGILSEESYSTKFIRCEIDGEIEVSATENAYIGALVGDYVEVDRFSNDYILDYFFNCKSNLNIKINAQGGNLYAGGIVGYSKNGTLVDCYNYGKIDITANGLSDLKVGGIAGGVNKIYSVYDHKIVALDTGKHLYNYGNITLAVKDNRNEVFVGGVFGEVINHNLTNGENLGEIQLKISNSKLVSGGIVGFSKVTLLEMNLNNLYQKSDLVIAGDGIVIAGGIVGINNGAIISSKNYGKVPNSNIKGSIIGEILGKDESPKS